MLSRFHVWKYMILVIMLIIEIIYALPNLYGEGPAVLITSVHSNNTIPLKPVHIQAILEKKNIPFKSIKLEKDTILVYLYNFNTQLHAMEELTKDLSEDYVITLNLAPIIPDWLVTIGAKPIKLSLDLRGGVYFLLEININSLLNDLQEKKMELLIRDLESQGISYKKINQLENYTSEILFSNSEQRDRAITWLKLNYYDLVFQKIEKNKLCITLMNEVLHQINEHAIQKNITILRNRINQMGISGFLVQRQGDNRIAIQLPGIQDTARIKKILSKTTTLEFRLVNSSINQVTTKRMKVPEHSEVKITNDGHPVVLYKQAILTSDDISDATFSIDEYNHPQVNIFLNKKGGQVMSNFTKNNIGKPIATLFIEYQQSDKKDISGRPILKKKETIINISVIQSRLGDNFRISGIKHHEEARQLAKLLRIGTLITPVHIVEECIIGPTLGFQNIAHGLKACLWGFGLSVLFMILRYRKFGLISVVALITNLVFITGSMSLLPGITLTMPGIAGIALTLSMAVDANVLINERIKEELRNGHSAQRAIQEGYRGAMSSIIDANVTTLITIMILYALGTSSIKGFAIATGIGIMTSMFTAIIYTRAIINLLYSNKNIKKLSI